MRRVAIPVALLLLCASAGPLLAPRSADDCPMKSCPMGGDMSCCAAEGSTGCDLGRCAPETPSFTVAPLPEVPLQTSAAIAQSLTSRPLLPAITNTPESLTPGPDIPPPRA